MRRPVRFILPLTVLACYAGVAGAAAWPYYGAITTFVRTATAGLPHPWATSVATPGNGSKGARLRDNGTSIGAYQTTPLPAATATAAAVKRHVTGKKGARRGIVPTQQRLAQAVQHLAASSKIPRRRINILILGSDNDRKFRSDVAPNTQVMIVASIDPLSHTVLLLSIPRDFYVRIPGYTYNTGPDGTIGWSKIDIASRLGFDSAACTVERNFGIPLDGWVWVGLNGFIRVIDTMDGVTIDVTHPVIDDTYPDDLANPNDPYAYRRIYIPPGPQHLNGSAALQFVRSRHGDVQSDFGRSQRQQILLTQLRRILLSQDAAGLVAQVPLLLGDFQHEIQTDLKPDLATASFYWSLLRSMAHAKLTQVVLQPPYSTPEYYVTDNDPQVEASNAGQPVQEDAVLPNWPLINQEIVTLFGGQSNKAPHCALVPGAH